MTVPIVLGVLGASLLGSVHCAGMCGGFVCFYAAASGGPRRAAHVAYNAGRLVSYLLLGAVAGTTGAALEHAGTLAGVARLAALVAGAWMVAWGGTTLLASGGVRLPRLHGRAPARLMAPVLARVRTASPVARALTLGLVTTLLPCGWLWAFVATAAGTGGVAPALAVMVAFWAGTLPVMLGIGAGAQRLAGPLRARLPQVTAATVVVLGLLSLGGHLRRAGHAPATGASAHAGHVRRD